MGKEYTSDEFVNMFEQLAEQCKVISIEHGFHDDELLIDNLIEYNTVNLLERSQLRTWLESTTHQAEVARMHSELSECLESIRKNPLVPDTHIPEFTNVAVEYADCIIRILDTCAFRNIPIGKALVAKMEYNKSRPYKHGKNS